MELVIQNRIEGILDSIRTGLKGMPTLAMMVIYVVKEIRPLAAALIEEEVNRQAELPENWPRCPHCGHKLRSKGFEARQILTLVGTIRWRRRVGRCPNKCPDVQVVPLDKRLDIKPQQKTGDEVKKQACMLAIFVPFDTARILLQQLTGMTFSTDSLWAWVQEAGQRITRQTEVELQAMAAGKMPETEFLAEHLKQAPLAIGADGVMAPIRPKKGTSAGKTIWREIKVGIMTRLTERINRKSEPVAQLEQRRVAAVMGGVDEFMPVLQLEANKQGISQAQRVVWLSDGGKGFWRIFESWLKSLINVTGILDFYHATQNISKAGKAWLDGRTAKYREWFEVMRHKLRHGEEKEVINELNKVLSSEKLSNEAAQAVRNTYHYLKRHEHHISYQDFKDLGLPIGSGLVESACKWLVQQRFKGVGMRWSEKGLNALLSLRVAWVNQRFDDFFPMMEPSPN
jgi:hypothetical protein